MNRRLRIDPVACDGYGYCAELVPEMISLDEWGYPLVTEDRVPPVLEDLVREAAARCPRNAVVVDVDRSRPARSKRLPR